MSMYKGHFNPSWVLSVADVTIIAQLASGRVLITDIKTLILWAIIETSERMQLR